MIDIYLLLLLFILKELVVPYIRVLCLAEGFDLDVQSAKSLIKSIQPPKLTFNKPSPEHLDLRRLINELQWLCISAPEEDREDDHMKYNVNGFSFFPNYILHMLCLFE